MWAPEGSVFGVCDNAQGVCGRQRNCGDSRCFVLAGYVSTVDKWDAFDALWIDALNTHPRIEYFKASEAESLKGQFAGFTEIPELTRAHDELPGG
jgi:hypothetical protein